MEYQKKLNEISAELSTLESKENRTAEDDVKIDELIVTFKEVRDKAEKENQRHIELESIKRSLTDPVNTPQKIIAGQDTLSEFRTIGEFIQTVRFNPYSQKLSKRDVNDHEMKTDELGGFLVPDKFIPEIKMVSLESSVIRPRATVIPAASPSPDETVKMPALDQTGTNGTGLYGGISVVWIDEGDLKPQKETAFKEITLSPYEVAGRLVVTDKLLRNAPAIDALVAKLFRGAINAAEEDAFFNGAVAGRPTGYIPHAATIAVNRATANRIGYADIVNMFASKLNGGSYVWVASSSAIAELMKMKDFESADSDAPNLAWQTDARAGMPGTLLGLPVLSSDLVPTLGTKGDLSLCDFSYYLIKDGYGIAIDASPHVHFVNNKTVIKAFWNVDGKPWMTAPLTLRNGTTKVSPFVVLDIPATES